MRPSASSPIPVDFEERFNYDAVCPHDALHFRSVAEWKSHHLECHQKDTKWKCPLCGKDSASWHNYSYHVQITEHNPICLPPWICKLDRPPTVTQSHPECGSRFGSKYQLTRHIRSSHPNYRVIGYLRSLNVSVNAHIRWLSEAQRRCPIHCHRHRLRLRCRHRQHQPSRLGARWLTAERAAGFGPKWRTQTVLRRSGYFEAAGTATNAESAIASQCSARCHDDDIDTERALRAIATSTATAQQQRERDADESARRLFRRRTACRCGAGAE